MRANFYGNEKYMKKNYIFAPGPTEVPSEVLLAGARATIHHRSADFTPIFIRVQEQLRQAFRTDAPVAVISSSGTGAVEAAIVSVCSPGDTIIVFSAGKFGERWVEIGNTYDLNVVVLKSEWGKPLDLAALAAALESNPEAKAVVVTQTETSTGTVSDIKEVGRLVQNSKAVSIVDAVSSFAAEELPQDAWGIDMVCTGSQKAVMLPPGLGLVSISEKAQALMKDSKCPAYYFSLNKYLKSVGKDTTPFTPAVNLFYSLEKALDMILEEGMESNWARHKVLARAARAAMVALGLDLFSESPSVVVTAVNVPEGVDWGVFNRELKSRGITIAGGQDDLKGKIFRIATLGYSNIFDVTTIVSAVEIALASSGRNVEFGRGVAAALEVLRHYSPQKGWLAAEEATRSLDPVANTVA